MKRNSLLGVLLGFVACCMATAGTYDTQFDFPDQKLTSNFPSGEPCVVNPAMILLVNLYFVPTDWTCEIRSGDLVMADPTQSAGSETGMCGLKATTLPPIFKAGAKAEVTIAKATIEAVRDAKLPEGFFTGLYLWDHAMGALTFFGAVRRSEAQDGWDWWRDHAGMNIEALSTRHTGFYVAVSLSANPSLAVVHGVEPIPDTILSDVALHVTVDDKGNLSFAINGASFAGPATVPQPGGAALCVFNTGASDPLPPWSDVTFKRFRVEGSEVPDGPAPPQAAKGGEESESGSKTTTELKRRKDKKGRQQPSISAETRKN